MLCKYRENNTTREMKSKPAGAAYKAARGNLLAMLILTAVNTLLALTGSDRYYLFTDFAAYIWTVFARGFYDFTGEAKWLVLGAAGAVLVMAVYFLCWLLSKKRRGWLTAALVLFSVDTAALVAGLVTAFEASSILDVVFHGLLLWYLAMGVRRGREAMEEPEGQRETPEPLPQNTEFYDASMGERPNSPSLGQPAEGKHRTLLTAAYGSHEIEVRRSYGLTELIVDGRVYGRQEGVVETGYTIRARVSGHDVETEFTPTGKQLLRVDGQVIARKQRLF